MAFTLRPRAAHYNPIAAVHGGVLAALLDSAMRCAVYSTLSAGTGYTTLDLHVRYLRPPTEATGALRAEGTVVRTGTTTAVAEGRVTDGRGRLIAHATEGCLVLPGWRRPEASGA